MNATLQESCTMKFEISGRNASSLSTILFRPSQIREMVSFVTEICVLPNKVGGFVTRQIKNTAEYLNNPSVDADFVHGFRRSSSPNNLVHGGLVLIQFIDSNGHYILQPSNILLGRGL